MGSLKNIYHVVIMIPRLIRFSVAVIEQAFKDFRGVGFFAYSVRKHEQVVTLSLSLSLSLASWLNKGLLGAL